MTAATDEAALLRAVLEHPDADTPRLVFADWLEEHDGTVGCPMCGGRGWTTHEAASIVYSQSYEWQALPGFATVGCPTCDGRRDSRGTGWVGNGFAERAEFIRVQCELARVDDCGHKLLWAGGFPVECRRCDLRARERELFDAHQFAWFNLPTNWQTAFDEREADGRPLAVVSRGFVGKLVCPAAAFTAELARTVFGAQPVTEMVLSDREPYPGVGPRGVRWWAWMNAEYGVRNGGDAIHPVLFALLGGEYEGGGLAKHYATRDFALSAMSAAAVVWGRQLAGMPPVEGL